MQSPSWNHEGRGGLNIWSFEPDSSNLWIIVFSAGDFTREVITKSTEKGNGEAFGTAQDNMVNTFGTSSRERTIEYTFGSL